MPRIGAAALVVVVIFALPGRAEAAWECRSGHFRAISETGPEAAQTAAGRLEAVRQRLMGLGLPPPQSSGPVVVLIFADRASLGPYGPVDSRDRGLTRGLSLTGPERLWIAVAWDASGTLSGLAHEYAHLVRADPADPLWFREGFAEYAARLPLADAGAGPAAAFELHPRLLREHPWTGWAELLAADRMSAAYARPTFYSQAWLAVHWLASRAGGIGRAQPAELGSLVLTRSSEWLDAQLRAHLERLAPEDAAGYPDSGAVEPAPAEPALRGPGTSLTVEAAGPAGDTAGCEPRLAQGWELPYWKAEFHRELDHWDQARPALEALEWDYPEVPEPSAALGAMAMDQGRYDVAERKARAAVQKGALSPHTHHRYSLLLLTPTDGGGSGVPDERAASDRVARAIWHARQARQADTGEPRYLLGEAQALLVAGQWDAAARLLGELRSLPGWGRRSEVEFAELLRRRQQAMRSVQAPVVTATGGLPGASAAAPPAIVAAWLDPHPPRVPQPPPPAEPKLVWPPPGTVLLYGHINGVECRASEKIVTVRTPRFSVELRETAASPAKLYHAPSLWNGLLPCGLRGHEVNVVYRPLPAGGEVRGELVAVVF